jgi:hypothetical protein
LVLALDWIGICENLREKFFYGNFNFFNFLKYFEGSWNSLRMFSFISDFSLQFNSNERNSNLWMKVIRLGRPHDYCKQIYLQSIQIPKVLNNPKSPIFFIKAKI